MNQQPGRVGSLSGGAVSTEATKQKVLPPSQARTMLCSSCTLCARCVIDIDRYRLTVCTRYILDVWLLRSFCKFPSKPYAFEKALLALYLLYYVSYTISYWLLVCPCRNVRLVSAVSAVVYMPSVLVPVVFTLLQTNDLGVHIYRYMCTKNKSRKKLKARQ